MLDSKKFEQTIDGKKTELFILKNNRGAQAAITSYGARWVSMLVPDKGGKLVDVVTGFDAVAGYLQSTEPYYGATIGRFANRIKKGIFYLDGKEYKLATNNGVNHLHGGIKGFQAVVWQARQPAQDILVLTYTAEDGEEGYPGNMPVTVTYNLTPNNEMRIHFEAATDITTIVNLTNHAYFNLNGQGSGTILNHQLTIDADNYTPIDETSIPLGAVAPVKNTPFDFTIARTIGAAINEEDEQLKNGQGYDHNFVLNKKEKKDNLFFAARAVGDITGITMEVYTQEPGLQLYSGNFMDGSHQLKGGLPDNHRTAFCLETQHFPDSPNQPHFPSVVLKPGQQYKTTTVFSFGIAT